MCKVLGYGCEDGITFWIVIPRVGNGLDMPVLVVEEVLDFVAEDFVVTADEVVVHYVDSIQRGFVRSAFWEEDSVETGVLSVSIGYVARKVDATTYGQVYIAETVCEQREGCV
jgi:ssRNA-specific RNase YbeY (16S rRNA maturation enzyme)